jgi:hypothetical protein
MRVANVFALLPGLIAAACYADGLRIEVLKGDGSNNRYGQLAQTIMLRVSDGAGKPVSGAAVIFSSPPEGPSVDFGGNGNGAQTTTDESGIAAGPSMRAAGGHGPVEIFLLAEKNGDMGHAQVHQMNLGFAAQAPPADLDLIRLPESSAAAKGHRIVRFKVTDGAGKPVSGARIFLVLPAKNGPAEVAGQAGPDGVAEFSLDTKLLRGRDSLLVRAEANRLTASRYIALE